jgi:hypothetical protein
MFYCDVLATKTTAIQRYDVIIWGQNKEPHPFDLPSELNVKQIGCGEEFECILTGHLILQLIFIC